MTNRKINLAILIIILSIIITCLFRNFGTYDYQFPAEYVEIDISITNINKDMRTLSAREKTELTEKLDKLRIRKFRNWNNWDSFKDATEEYDIQIINAHSGELIDSFRFRHSNDWVGLAILTSAQSENSAFYYIETNEQFSQIVELLTSLYS